VNVQDGAQLKPIKQQLGQIEHQKLNSQSAAAKLIHNQQQKN